MQGAADVASSAGARCKERRILHQARALRAGSGRSCVERVRSLQGARDLASSAGARFRAKKAWPIGRRLPTRWTTEYWQRSRKNIKLASFVFIRFAPIPNSKKSG